MNRNEKLADLLGMKKDVVIKLAEEVGIPIKDIEYLQKYPEEFNQWKAHIDERDKVLSFPVKKVINSERRQEHIIEQIANARKKKYEERERSVRTSKATIDPSLWLRKQYTNDDNEMVCQICKKEMPFRKRDGEHYFEAVEVFSEDLFPVEHDAQFLALCPVCAAMYKEFIKKDEAAMSDLRKALLYMNSLKVPLKIDEWETTIQFVETHCHDIKTILKEMGSDRG